MEFRLHLLVMCGIIGVIGGFQRREAGHRERHQSSTTTITPGVIGVIGVVRIILVLCELVVCLLYGGLLRGGE